MPVNVPKVIYLDQFAWIKLARIHFGKEKDPELVAAHAKVLQAADSGKVLFPLSIVTISETLNRKEPHSRRRLAEFLIRVSKGVTICPYTVLREIEIRNAVRKRVGIYEFPVNPVALGIANAFGATPEIEGNITSEIKAKLRDLVISPQTLLWLLSNQQLAGQMFPHGEGTPEKMEEIRKKDFAELPDAAFRKRVHLARNMVDLLSETITKYCVDNKILIQTVIPQGSTQESLLGLFQDCKTTYVSCRLTYCRDQHKDRPIERNDLNDIAALSMAIPYCDVVVTENFWTSIAKQEKLDSVYNTAIISSVTELAKHL